MVYTRDISKLTLEELIQFKDSYVKKYIGVFDKPIYYQKDIQTLNKMINNKTKSII